MQNMPQTVHWGDQAPSPQTLWGASPFHCVPFSTMATLLILLLSPNILIKPITLSKTSFLSVATVTDSVRKVRKAHGLINKAITTHGINRRELNW